jgi:hypothetical protein
MTAHDQAPWTGFTNYRRRVARLDAALIATANEFRPTARPPRYFAIASAIDRLAATKGTWNGDVARRAFQNLTIQERAELAEKVFETLENNTEGIPGADWNADTWQRLDQVFNRYGVTFTQPSD